VLAMPTTAVSHVRAMSFKGASHGWRRDRDGGESSAFHDDPAYDTHK